MILRVRKSVLSGTIAVPGSKSHTIRGVVAALQSSGKCVLRAPLDSEDTRSALEAAKLFGAEVAEFPDRWEIGGLKGTDTDAHWPDAVRRSLHGSFVCLEEKGGLINEYPLHQCQGSPLAFFMPTNNSNPNQILLTERKMLK